MSVVARSYGEGDSESLWWGFPWGDKKYSGISGGSVCGTVNVLLKGRKEEERGEREGGP